MAKETVLSVLKDIRELLSKPMIINTRTSSSRFEKLSDGWIKDNFLGIDWGPTFPNKMKWQEAEDTCKKSGHRQATPEEMSTLIDRSKNDLAIIAEAAVLNLKTDDWYWTSTPCAWYSVLAWCVDFSIGLVSSSSKGYRSYVRPVRSSQ